MKSTLFCCLLLLGLAALAHAQTAGGPTLGWTAAPDGRSLRTIYGVPGSSRLGPPIDLPADLRMMRLSPGSSIGVAAAGDPAWPIVYDVGTGARTALDSARANPGAVVWSPAGSAFAIGYPQDSWIQVFVATAGHFQLADEFAADGRVAVSDDGTATLLLSDSGLNLRDASGTAHLADAPVAAFTFLAGTSTPAFHTAAGLTIGAVPIPNSAIGDDTLFLGSPAKDRLVAIRGSGQTTIIDSSGQELASQSCNCQPAGFDLVGRAGTLLLLTPGGTGTLWLADAGLNARVYFVPPSPDLSRVDQ